MRFATTPVHEPAQPTGTKADGRDQFVPDSVDGQDLKGFHGWRIGVTICAVTSGLVFVINTTLTVWACFRYSLQAGLGTIQEGKRKETKTLNL